MSQSNSGYVYFIEAVGLDRVKIGFSKDPARRRTELQTGCPCDLFVRAVMPAQAFMEGSIHRLFDEYRLDGEWFHLVDELRDFIDGIYQEAAEHA